MDELMEKRILLVDDNSAIHDDFRKILNSKKDTSSFDKSRALLFNANKNSQKESSSDAGFILESAYQGQEALELVTQAKMEEKPFALAFVDIRMPPGWDGIMTIQKLWEVDPDIQMVLCSAHSDYSWEEISKHLNGQDNLLILKKPFDIIEVQQLASALTKKWELNRKIQSHIKNLEILVDERTVELKQANNNLDESLALTKATIEATQEGILVMDSAENILIYNNNFLSLWNIPEQLVQSKNSLQLLQKLDAKVKEPSSFLTMILNLCKKLKSEDVKELKLHSGQVFELYLHSYNLNHKPKGIVLSFREVTEKKQLEDQLFYHAMHDALTGLPNRILLMDRLQQAINYAKRNHLFVAVIMFDLDNFKQVNDSLGHTAGDELLIQISKKLQGRFRELDTLTRFGGDEFAIILTTRMSMEDVTSRAEKLKEFFIDPFIIKSRPITISASMGISVFPMDGKNPEDLLKNADSALYYAKEMGRNNFQFYTAEFNDNLLKKVELETALQGAIDNEEFSLHYQPLLRLNSDKIIGVEALLRWHSPSLGEIPPQSFIPIAEKLGIIIPIGNWVLKTACHQAKIWQKTICPDLKIAVNISGSQLLQKNFTSFVEQTLEESGLSPSCLELEITENIILENSSFVTNSMKKLKDLGVRFSVDDFGVGYSSLNYLKYFPFDKIKIDKSFIEGINLNTEDNNIVEAIINITKSMGLEVLAEGVETKEQIDFLRDHHSNEIQGYYISPPLNAKELSAFLKEFKQEKVKK